MIIISKSNQVLFEVLTYFRGLDKCNFAIILLALEMSFILSGTQLLHLRKALIGGMRIGKITRVDN